MQLKRYQIVIQITDSDTEKVLHEFDEFGEQDAFNLPCVLQRMNCARSNIKDTLVAIDVDQTDTAYR